MEISLEEVSFAYSVAGTQVPVLYDVSLKIQPGDFLAITGAGGSGKSTLAQIIAGLLEPTSGTVNLNGKPSRGRLKDKGVTYWQQVGMVYQQPEQQLFAETVFEDVAFGPRNLGLAPDQVDFRVKESLREVGLDPDAIGGRSPFNLSGGQQRRVAIAGIFAMKPEVLILDEPTAGLDPAGREQILSHIKSFYRQEGKTVIIVSHNMTEVSALARQVIVLHQGRLALRGTPREIFSKGDELRAYGLLPPPLTRLMVTLKRQGAPVPTDVLTLEEAQGAILDWLRG